MIEERIQAGARPRDVAVLVRSNDDADPFLRALNVKGIPHRFSGSRGLYAREEVRLLVSFLRVLANPDDSVSLFYLAASEVYRMPETELLRLNHYARRKTRPLLEVLRGLPDNEDLAGCLREPAARPPRGCSPTSSGRRTRCRAGARARCSTGTCSGRGSWGGSRGPPRPRRRRRSATSPASSRR